MKFSNMNKQQLLLDSFKSELDDSLLFAVIWNKSEYKELASLNANDEYIELTTSYLDSLENCLTSLGFPSFQTYQLTALNMDSLHLIINFDNERFLGALIDNSSVDIATLINDSIPKIIEAYKILREDN